MDCLQVFFSEKSTQFGIHCMITLILFLILQHMASSSGLTPTGFTAQDVKDLEAGIPLLLKEHQ